MIDYEQYKNSNVVIIAAGEINDYALILTNIQQSDFIIAVDGGYDHCKAIGIVPNLCVGDFDSLKSVIDENVEIITLPVKKDDSDTAFAVKHIMERICPKQIIMLGCTGGRLDHYQANLSLLYFIIKNGIEASIIDEHNIITFVTKNRPLEWNAVKVSDFSIFSFTDDCTGVTTDGTEYNLKNAWLSSDIALGLSNKTIIGRVLLTCNTGALLVIINT